MSDWKQIDIGARVIVRVKYSWRDGVVIRLAKHLRHSDDQGMLYYEIEYRGWLGQRKRVWVYSDDLRIPEETAMSGADEKMREVLELMAEDLVNEMCHPNLQQRYHDGVKILERRFLPILLAGRKCRLVCVNREVAQEYDIAETEASKS